MAAKDNSSTLPSTEGGTIREESSDFIIILENGEEFKCHKIKLAEASPVFRAMLKKDFVKQSDLVKNLKALVDERLEENCPLSMWRCRIGSFRRYHDSWLANCINCPNCTNQFEDHQTIGYYNLKKQHPRDYCPRFYCTVSKS